MSFNYGITSTEIGPTFQHISIFCPWT